MPVALGGAVGYALEQRIEPSRFVPVPQNRADAIPGRRNLSERHEPTPVPATPARRSVDTPGEGPRVRFTVPLPDATRARITAMLEEYARTRATPAMGPLRAEMLLLYLRVVIPASEERALRAIADHGLHFREEPAKFWEELVAESRLPQGKTPAHALERWTCSIDAAVLDDLRATSPRPEPTPTPTPSLETADETVGLSDALWWLVDLLEGDFNDNPTVAQTIINGVLGLIPGVDQALDIRDVIANLYALIWKEQYDDPGTWLAFVLTLIGAVPEIGSVVKSVGKLAVKGVKQLPIKGALEVTGKFLAELVPFARVIAERAVSTLNKVTRVLGELKESLVAKISATARQYLERLYNAGRAAIERARRFIDDALKKLEEALRRIVDDVVEEVDEVPATTKLRTEPKPKKPKREPAPKPTTATTDSGKRVTITRDNLNKGSGGETDIFSASVDNQRVVVRVPRGDKDGMLAALQYEKAVELEKLGGPRVIDKITFQRDGKTYFGVVCDRVGSFDPSGKFIPGFDMFRYLADVKPPFPITEEHLRALEAFKKRVTDAKVELSDVQRGDFIFTADGRVVPVDIGVHADTGKVGSRSLDELIEMMRVKLRGT
jgi:hypothetical protein